MRGVAQAGARQSLTCPASLVIMASIAVENLVRPFDDRNGAAELYIQGAETMSHEIGQLDIPDPRLRTTSARPHANVWTEIGEARITHTLFGRAKVRIIRKHDKIRRALWLTALAAVAALAVTAWQSWLAAQQPVAPQGAESALPSGADAIEGAPVTQSQAVSMSAAEPAVQSAQLAPVPAPAPEGVPQQAQGLRGGPPQTPAKPVVPLATSNIAAKSPAVTQPPVGPTPAKAPVAAAVVTPRVASAVTPPATVSPAEVPALINPVAQESVPAQSPAGDTQTVETAGDQP
jgi:hypothetical protein